MRDFYERVAEIENLLRARMPALPLANRKRQNTQRVVLGWDGMRVILLKPSDAPGPSPAELDFAVDGLYEDIMLFLPGLEKARARVSVGNPQGPEAGPAGVSGVEAHHVPSGDNSAAINHQP